MKDPNISQQIRNFINKQFPMARTRTLKDDDDLLQNGIIDSLGVLELVTYLEKEFAIDVLDDELIPETFQTVERLANFVQEKQQNGSGV